MMPPSSKNATSLKLKQKLRTISPLSLNVVYCNGYIVTLSMLYSLRGSYKQIKYRPIQNLSSKFLQWAIIAVIVIPIQPCLNGIFT